MIAKSPPALRLWRGETLVLESGSGFGAGRVGGHDLRATGVATEHFDGATLHLTFQTDHPGLTVQLIIAPEADEFLLRWQADRPLDEWGDAYLLDSSGHWFGGGELRQHPWPLSQGQLAASSFITDDSPPNPLLSIQTPFWLTSRGVGILADGDAALRHSLNDGDGCWRLAATQSDHLSYRLIVGPDLPSVYRAFVTRVGHPASLPPRSLLERPIWTTWTLFKTGVHQTAVLDFARAIVGHGFPRSVLEIDDRWQARYGDSDFDPAKFPDPRGMVSVLHDLGFAVTLWVMPFVDPASAHYTTGKARGYLVRNPHDGEPYLVRWWQGTAALLDVTHPEALAWFRDNLLTLQTRYRIDGFKFDAGEAHFLPPDAVTHIPIPRNDYSRRYVDFIAAHFPFVEVRTGWFSQTAPILFREWDKSSKWGADNGLASVIPQALTLSLTGYPFILPDIIGGNQYDSDRADAELLIRWTQASALLPAMQFSLPPWEYGSEVVTICRRSAQLHVDLAPMILSFAAEAVRTGEPIIRPIFWVDPTDPESYRVGDEFLLGDRYLVAPVVQRGAEARDIYLPAGEWVDHWNGKLFAGPTTLANYPAPLERLPLFERP